MNLRFKLEEKTMIRKFHFQFKISAHPSGEEISSKQFGTRKITIRLYSYALYDKVDDLCLIVTILSP